MEYDSENRKYAFCIINDKLYQDEIHSNCVLNMLKEKGENISEMFDFDNEELKTKLNGDVITGEITSISNKEIVMFYNFANKDTIKKHFDLPMYLYNDGDIKEIV